MKPAKIEPKEYLVIRNLSRRVVELEELLEAAITVQVELVIQLERARPS